MFLISSDFVFDSKLFGYFQRELRNEMKFNGNYVEKVRKLLSNYNEFFYLVNSTKIYLNIRVLKSYILFLYRENIFTQI